MQKCQALSRSNKQALSDYNYMMIHGRPRVSPAAKGTWFTKLMSMFRRCVPSKKVEAETTQSLRSKIIAQEQELKSLIGELDVVYLERRMTQTAVRKDVLRMERSGIALLYEEWNRMENMPKHDAKEYAYGRRDGIMQFETIDWEDWRRRTRRTRALEWSNQMKTKWSRTGNQEGRNLKSERNRRSGIHLMDGRYLMEFRRVQSWEKVGPRQCCKR